MAAERVFAFLLLVMFAIQLVAAGVVRPSEAPAQSSNALDDFMESLISVSARLCNDTDPSGGNALQLVQSLNNKMTALAATTRCHNSTGDCDVLVEMQRLMASWLRSHSSNASTGQQVAGQRDAQLENIRRLLLRINGSLARAEEFPQTIVSLDTR
ncbi:hypothetical protein R5R35_008211 [Gryllus longicercus]|uniref:Accessory gland protein n=1 Tax=Gryllus longicercus TaxID=2509291 RepID=A0AAN9YYT2_9ORTH